MLEVTNESFEQEVMQSTTPVVVDFWAAWCGPCKAIAPTLERLSESEDFKQKIKFVKVNVDETTDIAAKYDIRGIPTLVLFQGGEVVDTLVGANSQARISAWLLTHTN